MGVVEKACLNSGSSFPEDQESSFASGTSREDVALDQDLLAGSPSALDGAQMEKLVSAATSSAIWVPSSISRLTLLSLTYESMNNLENESAQIRPSKISEDDDEGLKSKQIYQERRASIFLFKFPAVVQEKLRPSGLADQAVQRYDALTCCPFKLLSNSSISVQVLLVFCWLCTSGKSPYLCLSGSSACFACCCAKAAACNHMELTHTMLCCNLYSHNPIQVQVNIYNSFIELQGAF